MFQENLRELRKKKGYSQQELAIRLNVVRQTISKWEKGLLVPDADMLIKMAEIFEVTVNELLGANIEVKQDENVNIITEQLVRINEQLAIRNNRWRKIWKTIGVILLVIVVVWLVIIILGVAAFSGVKTVYEEEEVAEAVTIEASFVEVE